MKNYPFSRFAALASVVAVQSSLSFALAEDVPAEAKGLIDETAKAALPHLNAALELANADAEDERNFAVFAKSLAGFGLGKTPGPPPWARQDEEDEKELTPEEKEEAEHHKQERAQRIKQIAQGELDTLQGIDQNKDLKTDAEEIEESIRGYLAFELNDRLSVDGDGDKKLTLQEYALSVPARGEIEEDGVDWHQRGHFKSEDKDENGILDIEELMGYTVEGVLKRAALVHLVHTLPAADKDGDKALNEEEFSAISEKAGDLWAEASLLADPMPLDQAYASLYWLSAEDIEALLP